MIEYNMRLEIFESMCQDVIPKEGIDWLKKNKFFAAPASSKYHLAYEGGLFEHSCNVAISLMQLTKSLGLTWKCKNSPIIIGLFHDLCKIDQYIWDPILKKYVWNKDQPIVGHGDKSIQLIEEHLTMLTDEEKACIRWHMGAFDEKENWTKYTTAIHEFPNVLWTHTADMNATHIMEQPSQSEGTNNGSNS